MRVRPLVSLAAAVGASALTIGLAPVADAATPAITFAAPVYYPTGQAFDSPSAEENGAALADLNGDGRLDSVVVAQWYGDSVVVQNGLANGKFQTPGTTITISGAIATENVAVGKFTSSGRIDIVVTTAYGFYVLRNDGGGHYTQSSLYQLEQAPFQDSLVTGDFNNDGKLDLAIKTVTGIQVELGNGDGAFTAGPLTTIPDSVPPGVSGVVTAKVNSDRNLDLFAVDAATQQVFALANNGAGGFTVTGSAITPFVPGGVEAVDNANGTDNAVVLREFNVPGTSVAMFTNNGSGALTAGPTYDGGYTPIADASGDFNGDGHVDVVSSDTVGSKLVILAGTGAGTLQPKGSYQTGLFQQTPAVGDVNGDGKSDIVVPTFCPTGFWYGQTCIAVLINKS